MFVNLVDLVLGSKLLWSLKPDKTILLKTQIATIYPMYVYYLIEN